MISFADSAKYSMLEYAAIYPSLGTMLDHYFGVIGNGMEWVDGCLTDGNDEVKLSALPALERAEGIPTRKANIPDWLFYPLDLDRDDMRPLQERLNDASIRSLYGLCEYSRITKVPDNVRQDWFNAAYTFLILIQNVEIENFSPYRICRNDNEREGAKKQYAKTMEMAFSIRADLANRFPEFARKYISVIGNISVRTNRPDVEDGSKYWPTDGSVVPMKDLIQPFADALKFCYRMEPRPGKNARTLTAILNRIYSTAVQLGIGITLDKVKESGSWRLDLEPCPPVQAVIEQYTKAQVTMPKYFDDIVEPFCKQIKAAFRLRRINLNKDVPYKGYPLGRSTGSLEPVEDFTVENLRYNHHDQGRDPLRTIVGKMFTVISEQGSRTITNDILKACEGLPPQKSQIGLDEFLHDLNGT